MRCQIFFKRISFAHPSTLPPSSLATPRIGAAKAEKKSELQVKTSNTVNNSGDPYTLLVNINKAKAKKTERTSNVDIKNATVQSKIDDRKADVVE